MNKQTLKNLYPELRPWERIRLLLAAEQRGDDVEYQRLFHASPIRTWYFSEHLLAEMALHTLALTYITEQLDAAASIYLALFQVSHDDMSQHTELEQMAESSAYFFTCNQQAWKCFCEKLHFDTDVLVRTNYLGQVLSYFDQVIPTIAPTKQELEQSINPSFPIVTTDDLLQRWLARLEEMIPSDPVEESSAWPFKR